MGTSKNSFWQTSVPNGYFYFESAPKKLNQLNVIDFNHDLAVRRALFDSGLRQVKAALASTKADFPSLPECKNLLLAAQKQLLELPIILTIRAVGACLRPFFLLLEK